ncbi:myeloid differentiation primary response 88, partial [Paramuricea clavata]
MASKGRKLRLASSLNVAVLEQLSMKLNPSMIMKDYRSLAGRLKYTTEYIQNFALERNPTLALLQNWWSSNPETKTVAVLLNLLYCMERDDCVDLLRPYEFY